MFEAFLPYEAYFPLGATFVVSIIPVFMLMAIPKGGRLPLDSMMCFAAGSLLADSLHHLVEEAGRAKDPQGVALYVLAGIVSFFLIDRLSQLFHQHDHKQSGKTSHSAGYLSLIADGVHNFTDGLAISASFSKGCPSGLATTLAIFMHEIPHELGDYAVLAKSGFGHGRIIQLQMMTAGAAFAGTAVGMGIQSGSLIQIDGDWLMPVTCGGFLYLALCTILGEVNGEKGNARTVLSNVLAMVSGIGVLHLLELYFD